MSALLGVHPLWQWRPSFANGPIAQLSTCTGAFYHLWVRIGALHGSAWAYPNSSCDTGLASASWKPQDRASGRLLRLSRMQPTLLQSLVTSALMFRAN